MPRPRKVVAVACIALVLVAAIVPLGGMSLDWFVVPTAFVVLHELSPVTAFVELPRCDVPSIACLSVIDFRGPPSASLA